MGLIERRIGLLFAVFLVLLLVAGARAAWLGVVKGALAAARSRRPSRSPSSTSPPGAARSRPPRRRARGLRARRRRLRHARTWSRTRHGRARSSRRCSGRARGRRAASKLSAATPASSTSPARSPATRGRAASRAAEASTGIAAHPQRSAATTRATGSPRRCSAPSAPTARGSPASSTRRDDVLRGSDGKRRIVRDALGTADRRPGRPSAPGPGADIELTLDAAIQDKVEEVLAQVGPGLPAQGRDRGRHGPAHAARCSRWPTGRASTPTTSAARPPTPPRTAPSASTTSRARPSRPSPSPARSRTASSPRTRLRPAADDQGRRPRDRGGRTTARPVDLTTARDPRAVQQRRHDQDRPAPRQGRASTTGCGASASARPTGIDLPGEERGQRPAARQVLGLVDGQPADRPGRVGHADADGAGLRRDRQRRHPAHAAPHRRVGGRPTARPRGQARHLPRRPPRSCARCSRASSRPAAPRAEVAIPGYTLAGKTGTANKIDPRPASTPRPRYVASFVGFAPAQQPDGCSSPSWSTSRRARSTAAQVAAPAFQEISASRCRTSASPRAAERDSGACDVRARSR